MFQGTPFYHGITKNTIIAFARLFSTILIQRKDNTNAISQTIAVPIAYANKEKALRRVDSDPTLKNETRVTLPRLAFEITGYAYDPSRKIGKTNTIYCNDSNGRQQAFVGTPYNINIALYIFTKTQEDGLQILEQIVPFFSPEYTLSLSIVPELNIIGDVPVVLNSVSVDDPYEGSYEDARIVTHTLDFTIKTNFYGPVLEAGLIKHVTANVKDGFATYHADGTAPLDPITESWTEGF